jgi:hypothetical protein
MPYINGIFVMEDSYNTPYYNSALNNHYWEPQLPPSIHIHPESPAGQLGYTLEELGPILHEQQQFLRDKFAQPPPTSTSYHRPPRTKTTPDPTFYAHPQQEAAKLGITPEELAAISEEATREQAEWLASDEANRKKRESERGRGEQRADRREDKRES